ncbi:clostripain-related cysteine peptidase [Desulfurobacterium atlanticum]|uniref:Clostripain n=1 Tax=Desulfurobacterium atlanticum TaxID=240169 RepID=A0A238ZDB6_9BACT|nr:clostripain-related cysteine peptidase [Desulfurobacterium atlanticum]SNR80694.1 clostripain [Desulfurobacterium atlanticum]
MLKSRNKKRGMVILYLLFTLFLSFSFYSCGESENPVSYTGQEESYDVGNETSEIENTTSSENGTSETEEAISSENETSKRKWTFMVFLNGDNDLENYAISDFLEMSEVGSTDDVAIVVLMDRIDGYSDEYGDWTGCKLFYVEGGMTPTPENATGDWGECNMGSNETLSEFLSYVSKNYPAEHYALVLWDHGDGWRSLNGWPDVKLFKIAGLDDTDYDELYIDEVQQALKTTNASLDLIGFDECLMAMVEVAYEFKDFADVMVASENTEPGDGWDYKPFLESLISNPDMNATELGKDIIDAFGEYYSGYPVGATLSLIDLGKLEDLGEAIDRFSRLYPMDWNAVSISLNSVQTFNYDDYVDVYDFFKKINENTPMEGAESVSGEILSLLNETVIYSFSSSDISASGLSIYFPEPTWWDDFYNDTQHDFVNDTAWNIFLWRYYTGDNVDFEPYEYSANVTE